MYTHARQFPHLAGQDDGAIRSLARRGLDRRPVLRWVLRGRIVAALGAALLAVAGSEAVGPRAMMVGGGTALAVLLGWNLVWVNTVLFRVTRAEVSPHRSSDLTGSFSEDYDPFGPAGDPDDWDVIRTGSVDPNAD